VTQRDGGELVRAERVEGRVGAEELGDVVHRGATYGSRGYDPGDSADGSR
jgi:hypothetical protein